MGRGTKFTELLKECMADALLQLMTEKSFEKISFQEIALRAGVGRSSWFRNFSSKEEALCFKLVQLWNRWEEQHGLDKCSRYTIENVAAYFAFNYSIRDSLKTIYAAQCHSCVYDAFYQVVLPQSGAGVAETYEIRFYTLGLYGLLSEWVGRDFQESPEEMADIFNRIVSQSAPSDATYLEKRS